MLLEIVLLFAAGFGTGFINVMAGGGSAITLPILVFLGYDVTVANGTNRVAILAEAVTGVATFKQQNYSDFPTGLKLGLMTVPGAILGAFFAVKIDDGLFMKLLGVVLILVILSLLVPKSSIIAHASTKRWGEWLKWPAMFFIGLYGGFIQAGVGFLMMAALVHLYRFDLVTVNMHKLFMTVIFTIPAVALFVWTGNVNWSAAIVLALGMSLGAWVSVRASLKRGEAIIRKMLIVALAIVAVKFLFF